MGLYLSLVAAELRRTDDRFVQDNQVFFFEDETYVAWCRSPRGTPSPGWTLLAGGTLRVQRPAETLHPQAEHQTEPVDPADEAGLYSYAEQFDLGDASGLFHLVLPPGCLPRKPIEPLPAYARPEGDRFVLGWIWRPGVWFRFNFKAVPADTFNRQAGRLRRSIMQGQAATTESNADLLSVETQLRTWYGNRRFLEEQAAAFGLDVPLRLHNDLENARTHIEQLENRRAALLAR